jgi:hypothetical protein
MYKIPSPRIRLYDRKELLRVVRDSRFPDQTGVEEVDNNHIHSAHQSMMKWLIERGQFTADYSVDFFDIVRMATKIRGMGAKLKNERDLGGKKI